MRRWATLVVGVIVGLGAAVTLLLEDLPPGTSVQIASKTRSGETTSSGCPLRCKKPEVSTNEVSIKSTKPVGPGTGGLLEKAFDNDAGIVVLRLLLALLIGATAGFLTARAVSQRDGPGPDPTMLAFLAGLSAGGSHSGAAQPEETEIDEQEEEDTRLEDERLERQPQETSSFDI